ncbi:hypothetical protein D9611_002065 [Ephemerocybe angulata]|uniref:Uncharacterized protein n=1 Tax=Ephemerocybe angulata TaxID=980116 RepID=A0A8H5CJN1_9AGAR|nr:hypothetical protein D9611_002065 [Tulosesus angulatus]
MPLFLFHLRKIIFCTCCLGALGGIVICGHWESLRSKTYSRPGSSLPSRIRDFEITTFVVGGLSELVLVGLLGAGVKERYAIVTRIGVELPVVGVLWGLWLVNSALIYPWSSRLYPGGCGAMTVLLYWATLLMCAYVGHARGNRVWSRSVKEASFFSHLPAAPKSLPPGTMKIEPSPAPTILGKLSVHTLRKEFSKVDEYLASGPSNSASSSSPAFSPVILAPSGSRTRTSLKESVLFGGRVETREVPYLSSSRRLPVVLEPEEPVPSRYDWYTGMVSEPSSTYIDRFKSGRRLSTIVESNLERRDTFKTFKSTKRPSSSSSTLGKGMRPSSSSSTLVKKKSEGSAKSKSGNQDSKRDSEQSFIIMFPLQKEAAHGESCRSG